MLRASGRTESNAGDVVNAVGTARLVKQVAGSRERRFLARLDAGLEAVVEQVLSGQVVDDAPVSVAEREQRRVRSILAVCRIGVARTPPEHAFNRRGHGNLGPCVTSNRRQIARSHSFRAGTRTVVPAELKSGLELPVPQSLFDSAFVVRMSSRPANSKRVPISVRECGLLFFFVEPQPVEVPGLILDTLVGCVDAAEPAALVGVVEAARTEDVARRSVDRASRKRVDVPVFVRVVQPHAFEVAERVAPVQVGDEVL